MDLLTWTDIIIQIFLRLSPVWVSLIILFLVSYSFKRSLGLYGKLFDSPIGMIGFAIVMFWVFAGFFAGAMDWIITHDPLAQFSGMKNKVPGTPLRGAEDGDFSHFLFGGDHLASNVFTRMIAGSTIVIIIAPMQTILA